MHLEGLDLYQGGKILLVGYQQLANPTCSKEQMVAHCQQEWRHSRVVVAWKTKLALSQAHRLEAHVKDRTERISKQRN